LEFWFLVPGSCVLGFVLGSRVLIPVAVIGGRALGLRLRVDEVYIKR